MEMRAKVTIRTKRWPWSSIKEQVHNLLLFVGSQELCGRAIFSGVSLFNAGPDYSRYHPRLLLLVTYPDRNLGDEKELILEGLNFSDIVSIQVETTIS